MDDNSNAAVFLCDVYPVGARQDAKTPGRRQSGEVFVLVAEPEVTQGLLTVAAV